MPETMLADYVERLVEENAAVKRSAHITHVFLKNITQALPQYVFWKDTNSVYLGCNQNFARLVGLNAPEAIVGKTDMDINWQQHGHTAHYFQQGDQATLAGRPIVNQEETLALPNGKTIIALVSKLPIQDGNKIVGTVGYFSDITELKHKEKELQQAKQAAEAANAAKSIFMANMGHEVRTPLIGMLGMAELVLNKPSSTCVKTNIQHLHNAGHALLDLLNEILERATLGAKVLPVEAVKFDPRALLNKLVALVTPAAQQKHLTLVLDCAENVPANLIGDPKRTQRILLHIINNAIKFTEKGTVTITANIIQEKKHHTILKISVQDTGIGIPQHQQKAIFADFQRLAPAYKGHCPGAGLGLSIAQRLMADMGSEIKIESAPQQGSNFICLFPLKKPPCNDIENMQALKPKEATENVNLNSCALSSAPSSTLKTATVLLVEDNTLIQIATKHQLERLHCKVEIASTGEEALALLKSKIYGLVFMDIGLPDISGLEVTTAFRTWEEKEQHHTPIIALTAHLDERHKQECLQAGMDGFFTKPLTDAKAKAVLERLVWKANNMVPMFA